MTLIFRLLPLISGLVFVLVLWQTTPPPNFNDIQPFQLFIFFVPLIILLFSLVNLIISNQRRSLAISLGINSLLILQAFSVLNLFSVGFVVILTAILIRAFKKPHSLITGVPIPRLSKFLKQR